MKNKLRVITDALMLAGLIIIAISIYYSWFKAGLPYQDPTTAMTIQWNAWNMVGESCLKSGGICFIIGLVGRILCRTNKKSL